MALAVLTMCVCTKSNSLCMLRVCVCLCQVGSCKEHDWFEQLIEEMLKGDNASTMKEIMSVCQMMVNTLVENVLALDENAGKYVRVCSALSRNL